MFRLQEWLADHVSWVQYPGVTSSPRPLFAHEMPWSTRAMLVLFGLIGLVLSLIALGFLGLFFWSLL